MTIEELLKTVGTSSWSKEYYLYPLTGAIWSMPVQQMESFPAEALIKFMKNHALLSLTGQHQWLTIKGGSIKYVESLTKKMRSQNVDIRLGNQIKKVSRQNNKVQIHVASGLKEEFDEVVFATHADDTLRLLADPSDEERKSLGAINYQSNDAVLHADQSLMPNTKRVWSSWVYSENKDKSSKKIDLTYWMNSLQKVSKRENYFVSINGEDEINERKIIKQVELEHPIFDRDAIESQAKLKDLNRHCPDQSVYFCGSYFKYGFHEDALTSAIDLCTSLIGRPPWS